MTDMICRKSLARCQTPGMCAPHGGCREPVPAPGGPEIAAAIATLTAMGYTYNGGQAWKPPLGQKPRFRLIDRLRCQLEVSEDTRQVLRKCLAKAESEIDALRDMKLPHFLLLSDEMRAAGDHAVSRAREDGCASVPVLYGVFFEAAIQRWLNDQEEIIDAAVTAQQQPVPVPPGTHYPINHGQNIIQFHDETFVWYDEAGLQGGVTYTLKSAETALLRYVEQLNKPDPRPADTLFKSYTIQSDAEVTLSSPRPAGCCCPPPGHTGIWGGAMCPVHQGLRRVQRLGYCKVGDNCVCGGDTEGVRAQCDNWVKS